MVIRLVAFWTRLVAGCCFLLLLGRVGAAELHVLPEFQRPDPFGGVVAADGGGSLLDGIELEAARGSYVSCHLVTELSEGGGYELSVADPGALTAELYREWFHFLVSEKKHYPDALIPVGTRDESQLPAPDNRIDGQTAQAYWLDIWVPRDAPPGEHTVLATLDAGGERKTLAVKLKVLEAVVPAEDAVTMDHNSYGSSWMRSQYPELAERIGDGFFRSDEYFELIHDYHRVFYEHRGAFHQLGYGHGGKVAPEYAPRLEGHGRNRRIASWELYDRHYGPLLDGSAFEGSRLGARPIPFVYLPVNPEWPASFLGWGEPGYEAEFVNVVSEMEQHFREKGWTKTNFEFFFNHKKRYKAFPWDGDETRFANDFDYFEEYDRLIDLAIPDDTPVQFVFRTDASWAMERQFEALEDVIDFWACGGGIFSWYPHAPELLKSRGNIVWYYGGTPPVNRPAVDITLDPLRTWVWGVDGYIRWLTTSPGNDPWFRFNGGATGLVYPGERFGIEEPLASIRLKLQRNALQDVALLAGLEDTVGARKLKSEVTRRYNETKPEEWWTPRPPIADTPPWEWTNTDIGKVRGPAEKRFRSLDATAWPRVREYVMTTIEEAR